MDGEDESAMNEQSAIVQFIPLLMFSIPFAIGNWVPGSTTRQECAFVDDLISYPIGQFLLRDLGCLSGDIWYP
jgi:hypothetical protein